MLTVGTGEACRDALQPAGSIARSLVTCSAVARRVSSVVNTTATFLRALADHCIDLARAATRSRPRCRWWSRRRARSELAGLLISGIVGRRRSSARAPRCRAPSGAYVSRELATVARAHGCRRKSSSTPLCQPAGQRGQIGRRLRDRCAARPSSVSKVDGRRAWLPVFSTALISSGGRRYRDDVVRGGGGIRNVETARARGARIVHVGIVQRERPRRPPQSAA